MSLICYNHGLLTEFFTFMFERSSSQYCIVLPTHYSLCNYLISSISYPSFNYTRSYSVIAPGDTVNVIGQFDEGGNCDINHDNNFLIVHPDILVSGTRVVIFLLSSKLRYPYLTSVFLLYLI